MVIVEVRSPFFNEEEGRADSRLLALVRAEGDHVEVSGSHPQVIDRGMPVLDTGSGETIYAAHAAEQWTRGLPDAFRSGDLVATIVLDSDPPEDKGDDKPVAAVDLPTIPAPPKRIVVSEDSSISV
jgi:hypothetical protein